jgi:hypothetical protein
MSIEAANVKHKEANCMYTMDHQLYYAAAKMVTELPNFYACNVRR